MSTPRRAVALTAATIVAAGLLQLAPTAAGVGTASVPSAPPAPVAPSGGSDRAPDRTLGNGLGRLLAQEQVGTRSGPAPGDRLQIDQEALAIRDDEGRVLVQLGPAEGTDGADLAALRRAASDLGFVETADDETTGVLEGFVPLASVEDLAALPDVGTVAQVPRPVTHRGRTTFQGVPFQGVNRVLRRGVDGAGITVGVLSDSYDTATEAVTGGPIATRARDDVRSGDLPGRGNPDGDTRPVVVLEDYDQPDSSDEGRAMLQIIHDAAPKARLCFATAFTGEVGFADNIRALADPEGDCRADVVVDDISYFSSPFFSDDVIGAAVEDVVASGVSYFSSAGNNGNQNAWRSRVDLVSRAGVPAAARRAGLDLRGVPRRLYAGGLQDMNPQRGTDVAQRLRLEPGGGTLNLKWSDPVDPDGPEVGEPVLSESGRLTAANSQDGVDFAFRPGPDLVGQKVEVTTDGVPSGSVDLVLTVTAPDGRRYGPVDTGTSPETVAFTVRERGRHTITVSGFQGARGRFTVEAAPVVAPSDTTTDFAALLFDRQGDYLGAVDEDNTATGRPGELADLALSDTYATAQLVIGRVSTGDTPVEEIGYVNYGGLYTDEYYSPTAPAIYGHPAAKGAVAVAAMDPFAPYLPESYTSPGGAMRYYFDADNNRLAEPEVRRKPDVTSTDAGNTTFFVADDPRDPDRFPNFGGTSAAAPMAAAIAALMLDEAGGPGSLSPAEVADTMKRTAFRQDLDPFRASGSAGGVTVSAKGFDGFESSTAPGSMRSRNFFRIDHDGSTPLRSVILSARTASPTALGARPGAPSSGLVLDPRPSGKPGQYARGGFPFTRGLMTGGVPPSSVTGRPLDRVGSTPFFQRLRVSFARPLTAGQGVRFGIDRDLRRPGGDLGPQGGNSADEIGGAVRLPSDTGSEEGMRFVATFVDGERVTGTVENRLGTGFTAVGGWGPVDAYSAVFGED